MVAVVFKPTSLPYVQTGLVLHLDAGNVSSYSGSGSTWSDLSGNGNHGTLYTSNNSFPVAYSSSQGGYLTFNRTYSNNFSVTTANSNFNYGTGDFSIEIWVYPTLTANGTYDPTIFTNRGTGDWNSAGAGIRLQYGLLILAGNGGDWINFSSSIQLNVWQQIVISRIGNDITVYKNKVSIGTRTVSGLQLGSNTDRPCLAISDSLPAGREQLSGRISMLRIYKSKGLTSSEVTQNFDAFKSRYGL
jgi:hypothetical protein